MELEDLKSTWESVKPNITGFTTPLHDILSDRRKDARTRLLRRAGWSAAFTTLFLVLMATSRIWAPMKLSAPWIVVCCAAIAIGIAFDIILYTIVWKIRLSEQTNSEILSAVMRIKRLYRHMELAVTAIMLPTLVALSFSAPFAGSWRMYFVWVMTAAAFAGEMIWYRSNIRQLDRLDNS